MQPTTAACLSILFAVTAASGCRGELANDPHLAAGEPTLVGQLLLPPGTGSRGVEVRVSTAEGSGEPPTVWVLFDEQGRFAHTFRAMPTSVTVTAGSEVHRIDSNTLHQAGPSGRIDLGAIDLRDRLTRHRLRVREAAGKLPGEVRVGMFFGPPPVGPQGEPVSLGSRQFPPIELGSEMEWLVPIAGRDLYFLVERPLGFGSGTEWRSGVQRLFGPFAVTGLPNELVVD